MSKTIILLPIPLNRIAEDKSDMASKTRIGFMKDEIERIIEKYENPKIEIDNRKVETRISDLSEQTRKRLTKICNQISVSPSQLIRIELFISAQQE